MVVGIITTLVIREPQVNRIYKDYKRTDYYRLVAVFFVAVISFVLSYIFSGTLTEAVKSQFEISDSFLLFCFEALRFIGSAAVAVLVGTLLVKMGAVNKQMAFETWVNPIADFFKRYGVKLALVLLLLIGFYRISDIIAGVISNVFYQDLNFTKEQIAEAVKIYGVIFSLVGGFLGGLLAQRMNIMKLMFVGAVLASSTNLIFVGLVKSGQQINDVNVTVGQQNYKVQSDEVGYWKLKVPSQVLAQADELQVAAQYQDGSQDTAVTTLPYLKQDAKQSSMQILPVTSDNTIALYEKNNSLVIRGQYFGQPLSESQKIVLSLDGQTFDANLDKIGIFSAAIPAKVLINSTSKNLVAEVVENNQVLSTAQRRYTANMNLSTAKDLDVDVQPLPVVNAQSTDEVEITGKVIKPYSSLWLYFAIIVDNLASGLAGAAFIAFLSSLTSVSFTAVQYAIFSSLMTLTPKILGGYSGTIVSNIGYPNFFLMTTLIGIPILILVVWVAKLLREHQDTKTQ
jgi:PAT family beta-lactamase induction signal transducer AmpG